MAIPVWKSDYQVNTVDGGLGGSTQNQPEVIGLTGGGYVIVWTDQSSLNGYAVKAQIFDILGNTVGVELTINSGLGSNNQANPSVSATSNGGFVVAWEDEDSSISHDIFARTVDKHGSLGTIVGIDNSIYYDATAPHVQTFEDGSYVVFYERDEFGNGDNDIYAVTVSTTGQTNGPSAISSPDDEQAKVNTTLLSSGNVVVVFHDEKDHNASNNLISFAIMSPNGSMFKSRTLLDDGFGDETDPQVVGLKGGGFVIVWEDSNGHGSDTGGSAIVAQIYNNNGDSVKAKFTVNNGNSAPGVQNEPTVTATNDGGFLVAWDDDTADKMYMRQFDNTGNNVGGTQQIDGPHTGNDTQPDLALLGDGRIVFTYTSVNGDRDIHASILDTRGNKILGTSDKDFITARIEGGTIKAKAGNDKLFGQESKDKLYGQDGKDKLFGGGGKDKLYAGEGKDQLTGGGGKDTFIFNKHEDKNTIKDFENGKDKIDLKDYNFASKAAALSHFYEIGSGSNDKLGFNYKGTKIVVKGIDMDDLNGADIII